MIVDLAADGGRWIEVVTDACDGFVHDGHLDHEGIIQAVELAAGEQT